jgi:hypothetical protein
MRWLKYVACATVLVGKPDGKRSLGRPRCRWECNTRMGLTEIWCEDVDWIHVTLNSIQWQAFVNTLMIFKAL